MTTAGWTLRSTRTSWSRHKRELLLFQKNTYNSILISWVHSGSRVCEWILRKLIQEENCGKSSVLWYFDYFVLYFSILVHTLVFWYIVALSRYLYGLDFGQELAQNRAHINSVLLHCCFGFLVLWYFSCTGTFLIFLEFDTSIFFGSSLLFGTFGHFCIYFGTYFLALWYIDQKRAKNSVNLEVQAQN